MKTVDFIVESYDKEEYSDEAGMVHTNLHTIVRACVELAKEIKENEDLPEWCQEKIANAKGMMVTVMDYIISQHEDGVQPEVPQFDSELAEQFMEEHLKEFATGGASGSASIATTPGTGSGKNTGSLFGGSYQQKSPFNKKKTKK